MRSPSEFGCPDRSRRPGPGADTRFRQWVLGLHQLLPATPAVPGPASARQGRRDCSCGSPAVLCPYLRAASELLGYPMPWDAARHVPPPARPGPPKPRGRPGDPPGERPGGRHRHHA